MVEPTDEDLEAAIRAAGIPADEAELRRLKNACAKGEPTHLARSIRAHAVTLAKAREAYCIILSHLKDTPA